jgi:hypothetical protein
MSEEMEMTSLEAPRPTSLVGCLEVCRRCESLVDHLDRLGTDAAAAAYLTIGPHLRHCMDHFSALVRGLPRGVVDYDARDRDETIERDPGRFLELSREVRGGLESLADHDIDRSLEVRQQAARDPDERPMSSNLERELVFLSSHTIHHLAMMVALLASDGIDTPEGIDVAFSTATYRTNLAARDG